MTDAVTLSYERGDEMSQAQARDVVKRYREATLGDIDDLSVAFASEVAEHDMSRVGALLEFSTDIAHNVADTATDHTGNVAECYLAMLRSALSVVYAVLWDLEQVAAEEGIDSAELMKDIMGESE